MSEKALSTKILKNLDFIKLSMLGTCLTIAESV